MLQVAVGVVCCPAGRVLIAFRSPEQHLGGLWEFPGGKIKPFESTPDALKRELEEEVGIQVKQTRPLIKIRHDYPDKSVLLDVLIVDAFDGEAYGREGQQIAWVHPNDLDDYRFPEANKLILKALSLPSAIAITGAFTSVDDFESRIRRSVARGAQAVYLRIGDHVNKEALCQSAESLCAASKVRLLTNRSCLPYLKGPVGLHLTALDLAGELPCQRDGLLSIGASCHSADQVEIAVGGDVDYVFLSPVFQTDSHPESEALGLDRFESVAARCPVPVYALGGVSLNHLDRIRARHGFGIAAIQSFWG